MVKLLYSEVVLKKIKSKIEKFLKGGFEKTRDSIEIEKKKFLKEGFLPDMKKHEIEKFEIA